MPTFSCEYCKTSFNVDYPDDEHTQPNRKNDDSLSDSVTTTTRCLKCQKDNILYWSKS